MNTDEQPKDNRQLAMGLAFAAAACLLYAAFTGQWLVNNSRYSDVQFGLRNNSDCHEGDGWSAHTDEQHVCERMSNSALIALMREQGSETAKQTSSAFAPAGWITFVIILLAAAGLLGAGGMAAARKQLDLPIAPTTVALLGVMILLITGCLFVATKPGPGGMLGVGLSFWVFGIGCVMGIVGAQMLAKVNRPPDPEWTVDG